MNRLALAILLFLFYHIEAQCPFSATIASSGNCPGAVLTAGTPCQQMSKIVWYNNNAPIDSAMASNNPSILTVAGGNGVGPSANQLSRAFGIFIDGSSNLYVCDYNNYRVQKWAPCADSGVTVAGGNGFGTAANQLAQPFGLWVDGSGNVFVSDNSSRVQKWAPGATSGITVAGGTTQGRAANQLFGNLSLGMDAAGNLYMTDNGNNRIQKWAPGATSGVTVAGGFPAGSAANQLNYPTGIFVDSAGDMYIADQGNNRVQYWAAGAATGVTVIPNNGYGSAPNQLNAPADLWVDKAGNIYVADFSNNRVQKWAPGAASGVTVAGGHGVGSASDQLNEPFNVFVDGSGDIYVSDGFNNRVQEYTEMGSIARTYTVPSAGNYTAVITSPAGCSETSNSIPISPVITPAISITGPTAVCGGNPVTFTVTPVNGGAAPSYQWQINGQGIDNTGPQLIIGDPVNQEVISCTMTSDAACPSPQTAGDTLPPFVVYAPPIVDTDQVFVLQLGQAQTLTPAVSGDIATYSWSPVTGLSSPSSGDPVADLTMTTVYQLQVTSVEGCKASAAIKVEVATPQLVIPNAFTPNGDGKNDIFFVLGAPAGSVIRHFSIFNRWGQQVFSVKDAQPGDPAYGWNGYYQGTAAQGGTYVYVIELEKADGTLQQVKGTVILVR